MDVAALRRAAGTIWQAAFEAASAEASIRRAVEPTPSGLRVGRMEVPVPGKLVVVGAGKAGAAMARAIEDLVGRRVTGGVVVTKYGHRLATGGRIRILEAGHPVPDRAGLEGAALIRACLRALASEDVVLCLISGGGSALMPLPAPGVTLEEKRGLTSRLLDAGATIRELNAVRKHLSAVKGGQLARWAAPARVVSLVISDVIGDPLDCIASGPTSPDGSTFQDALDVLVRYEIEVPPGVYRRLRGGIEGRIDETPRAEDPLFRRVTNHVIANNQLLVSAASAAARTLGFHTKVLGSRIEGEAREVGERFAAIGREIASGSGPIAPPACLLGAGETTVTVRGGGRGGRNLEMALSWALEMSEFPTPCCFASLASDGTDGPTDAAGGLVDPMTCRRSAARGLDAAGALAANDSLTFLDAAGDAVRTGPTRTNLMDLQILLVGGG